MKTFVAMHKAIDNNTECDINKSANLKEHRKKRNLTLVNQKTNNRIIIIDDEQRIRIIYSQILDKAGYSVKSFGDNKTALHYLKNTKFKIDLFILDLAMPKIDGCNFFEIIKTKHPGTKILIASNYELDTQKFMVFDADGYFDKTEGTTQLLAKVKQLIGTSKDSGKNNIKEK